MLIQCTKKLLDQLNIKPELNIEEEPLLSWHANLITFNRRKTVVLVNDKNRYVIVMYGLKAKDFKTLDKHIINAINKTFQDECIKEEIIQEFINYSKNIVYTKTRDRSSISRVNKACELVPIFDDLIQENTINQCALNIRISKFLVSDPIKDYICPNEEMYKDLEVFTGKSIFECKAIILKVTLDLEKQEVWRRLVVPMSTTFEKLHRVLQTSFGWKDYHLHSFFIYDHKSNCNLSVIHSGYHKEGYKPIIELVCNEEAFDYQDDNILMRFEKGIRLTEYIPNYTKFNYNYDFGDDWKHYIEVEKVIVDYKENFPVCLEGQGNTPPEDVGGKYGYEEFLEIISDDKHPNHDTLVNWAISQGYKDFNIESVNKELKIL